MMITADELTQLRKSGAADADILTKYREFDPQHDSDIDTLLKRGETPGAILDGLSRFTAGGNEAPKEDRMASKGVLEKTRGALQFGASNLLAGLSATAKHSGFKGTADVLQSGAKSLAPTDYEAAGSKFDVTSPSTYGYAPRALLEGAPGVITDLAAGAAGGVAGPAGAASAFMASNAARNFGSNVDARMENQSPGANPSVGDYLASGGATAAEAVLSRVGLNPALNGVAKGAGMKAVAQVPGLIAKAAGADAAAGAAGDVVNQVGRTAGTEQGLSVNPKEALNASALAGATGGTIRAARGVGDVTNAVRFKDVDDAAAARVVERMDRLQADTGSPEKAYKSVEIARKSLDTEIADAHSVIKPLLKSKGNDTDTDNTRVLVKDTLTVLKNGGDAPEGALTEIKSRLGDTDEGFRFVSLLEDRQALNNLMSQGRYEKSADKPQGYFGGGITSTRISDNALDPTAILKSKLGLGAAGSGIAGLSFAGQLGAIAPIMAKVAAAQTALYGGARAIDSATGLKNPAKEFMNRFRGDTEAPQADLPSFRQEALDAKEAKATSRATPDPIKLAKARAKQEDRAWKAKQAEEAAAQREADRIEREKDKAFNSNEDPRLSAKEAQEDAMWRQRDQETALAEMADGEASEGIRAGYGDLLKQAVTKGEAARKVRESQATQKAKDTDKAFKAKAAQEAQEARQQAEADKAWESREGRPGPSEDALWASYEKTKTANEVPDLEAEAGIQAGYKALAAKAKKAADVRESQTDKAFKEKKAQEAEEARQKALRNSGFAKAEAERNRPDPERVKKAQEDAMWRQQEEG